MTEKGGLAMWNDWNSSIKHIKFVTCSLKKKLLCVRLKSYHSKYYSFVKKVQQFKFLQKDFFFINFFLMWKTTTITTTEIIIFIWKFNYKIKNENEKKKLASKIPE